MVYAGCEALVLVSTFDLDDGFWGDGHVDGDENKNEDENKDDEVNMDAVITQYTEEELLQIAEEVNKHCGKYYSAVGRMQCENLCHNHLCCFYDSSGCVKDESILCGVYAGCEVLVHELGKGDNDVSDNIGNGEPDIISKQTSTSTNKRPPNDAKPPPPPPVRCISDEDDRIHTEVYSDDWTDDRYARCRKWEKKYKMAIMDYWNLYGIDSQYDGSR